MGGHGPPTEGSHPCRAVRACGEPLPARSSRENHAAPRKQIQGADRLSSRHVETVSPGTELAVTPRDTTAGLPQAPHHEQDQDGGSRLLDRPACGDDAGRWGRDAGGERASGRPPGRGVPSRRPVGMTRPAGRFPDQDARPVGEHPARGDGGRASLRCAGQPARAARRRAAFPAWPDGGGVDRGRRAGPRVRRSYRPSTAGERLRRGPSSVQAGLGADQPGPAARGVGSGRNARMSRTRRSKSRRTESVTAAPPKRASR